MISAIDTNILIDVLIEDPLYADSSLDALQRAGSNGKLIIAEVVFAELASQFQDINALQGFLRETSIDIVRSDELVLYEAGVAWKTYRARAKTDIVCARCGHAMQLHCTDCGQFISPRIHILSDFLIGAHATRFADLLITRDRSFYRAYFEQLTVTDPSMGRQPG
jgi:predicted nucleic acid-binding protein